MRANQALAVILLSASTAVATMWTYNHFTGGKTYYYSQDTGKVPSNYVKFFEGAKKKRQRPCGLRGCGQRSDPCYRAHQNEDGPYCQQ